MLKGANDQMIEERVLESDGVVAVAFLSRCSIPCDHYWPELKAIAEQFDGKIEFLYVNADENPSITDELGVDAVPTLLVFRDGDEIAKYEGPYSRESMIERLNALLAKGAK